MDALAILFSTLLVCFASADISLPERKLRKTANCFSLNLYKKLLSDSSLVSSPFSLDLLLSLLLAGAGGQTAQELVDVLGYGDLSVAEMQDAFQATIDKIECSGANTLTLANSVWLDRNYDINNNFRRIAYEKFSADVFSADFARRPRQAREKINTWVNSQTDSLISPFLKEDLDQATIMVLVNAIYFKGQWMKRFNSNMTRRGTFHNRGSKVSTSRVHMMTQLAKFNYKYDSELKAEVLEIPYTGNNVSMIILLPQADLKFETFEEALTCEKLEGALRPGLQTVVDITMPIFELTSYFDLENALKKLGVQRIFDMSANLSGISKNLYISKSVQNTVFSVSEEGSEGAAASAVIAGKRTVTHPPDFVWLQLDRPFMFLVHHKIANLLLFVGRVTELPDS